MIIEQWGVRYTKLFPLDVFYHWLGWTFYFELFVFSYRSSENPFAKTFDYFRPFSLSPRILYSNFNILTYPSFFFLCLLYTVWLLLYVSLLPYTLFISKKNSYFFVQFSGLTILFSQSFRVIKLMKIMKLWQNILNQSLLWMKISYWLLL